MMEAQLQRQKFSVSKFKKKNNNLLDTHNILRNACTVGEFVESYLLASFKAVRQHNYELLVFEQMQKSWR